jgi:hypothetical protein
MLWLLLVVAVGLLLFGLYRLGYNSGYAKGLKETLGPR